jgi:hypothetical protein
VAVALLEGDGTGAAAERVFTKGFQLAANPIQTETELRLREAGMLVYPADRDGSPVLVVRLSAAGDAAVLIDMYVLESATLDRGSFKARVRTWEHQNLLQYPSAAKIREVIRDGVSSFLNQWLADKGK